nr:squalene synthase HpnC [uncultured Kingella sp.]
MHTHKHYENFPVGSLLLPHRLRRPIHAVYAFARTADDIADEGDGTPEQRRSRLAAMQAELDRIRAGETPHTELMKRLAEHAVKPFALPVQPFDDLLSAFMQDTEQMRYRNFADLVDYARRSANPVGRIILHLNGTKDPRAIAQSDGICTALQLVNFWQDIAADWQKGRIYLPQDDMEKYGVAEADIARGEMTPQMRRLIAAECERAKNILYAGAPLGKTLKGRLGMEVRMIVLGGARILEKIAQNGYDVFRKRPVLEWRDWLLIVKRAWQKK